MNQQLVTLTPNNEAVTTSLAIAEGTEVQHKNVYELIKNYHSDLSEFGIVTFETEKSAGAGRPTEYAILNEDQATLLITYMRNSERVRLFKKQLVKAFREMHNTLQAQAPRQLSRLEIAEQLVDSLKREEQLLLENTLKQQKIEEDAPKITIYNQVMDSTSEYSFSEVSGFIDCLEEELTMCCKHAGWLQSKSIKRIATFKGKHEGWLVPKAGKEGGVAMFTAKGVERVIIGIERMQNNSPLVYDKIFGASKAYGRKFKLEEKRKYEALVAYVTKKREDEAKKGA